MKIGGRYFLGAYRALAIIVAAAQLQSFQPAANLPTGSLILLVAALYSVLKLGQPADWYYKGRICSVLLVLDLLFSGLLLFLTGGLESPFILFSFSPILAASLFLDIRITGITASFSIAAILSSHLINPWYSHLLTMADFSFLLVYFIAACLVAILPYLINTNLRQELQSKFIMTERQRLSREIHDGMAQTLSGLCWQTQLLEQRLHKMGLDLVEVEDLIRLTEDARRDARESLELLREYTGNGEFISNLRQYLQHLKQSSGIIFELRINTGQRHLTPTAEIELLRICQEALNNVRKHSAANHVTIVIESENNHLTITITDDGRGFDSIAFYRCAPNNHSHGLAIMQERAESIGGRFRIISLPLKGTEIQVVVPTQQ
ncbi:MAG: sensor histidine kinase [Dehalogenimonas sp.]|uniref:histidine kinase n=1 Tax=Candidatus Dehalogenimonas loeffleri TaxID=3127115 RepID=A0ABZ2J3S4_9CHLR|nr:sensor histidine kinase [Dehalogenimonas sp.]